MCSINILSKKLKLKKLFHICPNVTCANAIKILSDTETRAMVHLELFHS